MNRHYQWWFQKKYPKANIDKFEFGYNLNDGTLKTKMCTIRLHQSTKTGFFITDSLFLNNEEYEKNLNGPTINKEKILVVKYQNETQ